jgi:hypothetical protein
LLCLEVEVAYSDDLSMLVRVVEQVIDDGWSLATRLAASKDARAIQPNCALG